MRSYRHRAFTLLEVMLTSVLMLVVGTFGIYSLVGGRQSTQSRGMAEEIAEELKAARQQAVSKQVPVAVAFPSNGRSTGCSQSFYLLQGVSTPHVFRAANYTGSYNEACFFWGLWGGATPEPVVAPVSEVQFDLTSWGPLPRPDDYLLVFTPQGTVVSNGLPVFAGREYRLLVSNGVQEGGGGLLKQPSTVSKPYTVRISKSGAITVTPGVVGENIPEVASIPLSAANTVPKYVEPSGVPSILDLRCEPVPEEGSVSGAHAVVPDEGYITLVVEASDPWDGPLTAQWTAEGPKGSGRFSSEAPMTMTWEPKHKDGPRWTARTSWTPPPNAGNGEVYELKCTVSNPRGKQTSQVLGAGSSVEVVRAQKIAVVNTDEDWENYYVAWLNPAGSHVTNVTVPDILWEQRTPVWSPNGTKLAFYQTREDGGGDEFIVDVELFVVNDDGTGLTRKFSCRGDFGDYNFGPSFSPDGAMIAFSSYATDDYRDSRVWRCSVFGDAVKEPLTDADPTLPAGMYADHTGVSWNPVYQRWILYTSTFYTMSDDYRRSRLMVVNQLDKTIVPLVFEPEDENANGDWDNSIDESHWSFDGRKIVYTHGGKLFYIGFNPADGTRVGEPVDITPAVADFEAYMPRFSPDDLRVAVVNLEDGGLYVVEDLVNNPPFRKVVDINYDNEDIDGYCWSPDGEELSYALFDYGDDDVPSKLYTVSASGGGSRDITPPGFSVWSAPSWWAP
jgi:hypothetical protein